MAGELPSHLNFSLAEDRYQLTFSMNRSALPNGLRVMNPLGNAQHLLREATDAFAEMEKTRLSFDTPDERNAMLDAQFQHRQEQVMGKAHKESKEADDNEEVTTDPDMPLLVNAEETTDPEMPPLINAEDEEPKTLEAVLLEALASRVEHVKAMKFAKMKDNIKAALILCVMEGKHAAAKKEFGENFGDNNILKALFINDPEFKAGFSVTFQKHCQDVKSVTVTWHLGEAMKNM